MIIPQIVQKISIHALREEGDARDCGTAAAKNLISIHALREEGDHWAMQSRPPVAATFLSTPSARRATLLR